MNKTYLYMVYETYFRYKEYDKFHEVDLTDNQLDIKEKYLEKEKYKMEFFEVAAEYASKVFRYIQDKFIKSSFPINVRSGELQSACSDFIRKCNDLMVEKMKNNMPLFQQQQQQQHQQHKAIALVVHRETSNITVVCNSSSITPADFMQQLLNLVVLHVCQHAIMLAEQVDLIMSSFQGDFASVKSSSTEMGLAWYCTTEQVVAEWMARNNISTPKALPPPVEDFKVDDFIVGDFVPTLFEEVTNNQGGKKRKTG